ncbi:DNA-(apurinic or apyrimidinic site) lyase 2 isoform X3 [Gopherus evgoodei]|uniref:DNA-(apurinic or apyrimidinic site) lyase 2 isoform X3 n=1 Tax=Gopherus evgoodei TaxID=1825980 RepID=UPI0011CF9BF8|nr:DNA-(apurinic or apyrimidinic site) lyase 2 isoform X3 [Gopherus evgoodei]
MDMEVVMAGGVRGQRAGPAMGVGGTVQKGAGGAQPDPTVTPCPQGTCWRSHWPWWTATTPTSASAAPGAATQVTGEGLGPRRPGSQPLPKPGLAPDSWVLSRSFSPQPGVATFCKDSATPLAAEEGLSGLLARPGEGGAVGCYGDLGAFTPQELKALDSEGRAVITHHRIRTSAQQETTLTVINVYCPRADPQRPERAAYQASFYQLLQGRAEALLRDGGHVVILGDINTSHRPIDHCEPGDLEAFQEHPGRRWLDGFLWAPDGPPGQGLFVDTFRLLHPSQPYAFTCWRIDTGARLTNHGTRLDYVLADRALALAELRDARILPEVPGSDHCPVLAELAATFLPAPHCPPLCTRHMPEFAGTQQKLSRFLVRVEPGAGAAGVHRTCRGAGVGRGCSARRGRRLPRGQGDLLRYFRAAQGQLGTGMGQNGQELDQNASGHGTQELAQDALGQRGQEAAHSAPGQGRQLELTMGQAAGTQLSSTAHWRMVLCGPTLPPCCPGHREPCALRTVRKPGPNTSSAGLARGAHEAALLGLRSPAP